MSSRDGVPRAVGRLLAAAVECLLAWLAMSPALVPLVLGATRVIRGSSNGSTTALGTALVGLAATAVLGVAVARPLAAATRRRVLRGTARSRGWLDARSVTWLATTLTLRAAVCALGLVVVTVAGVSLAAPWLVRRGDRVDLGPWHVDRTGEAVSVAIGALLVLVMALVAAPRVDAADRALASGVLSGREERLERQLADASSSRARILDAADQERRRIERDLHDGVQPEILGVSMTLGLALASMPQDDPARQLVARAQQQSLDALENVRRFVRGVHPQVLDDHGLAAALSELAEMQPTPTHVDDLIGTRLPAGVESSLYYASAELITNVGKHSGATGSTVVVDADRRAARVTVTDDGHGGADPDGRGLTGVRDRLAALGGSLDVSSPPGGPTRVTAELPLRGRR